MMVDAPATVFDDLYAGNADPWGTQTRWYEARKRRLVMASLTRRRYRTAYECGCGTGHLSVELAAVCDALVASDASPRAVAIATEALDGYANVRVEQHTLPGQWPDTTFELLVLGELLYFVGADARARIADLARRSAGADGLVVACDWRHVIEGRGITGEKAHREFAAALALPVCFEYVDEDFVLTGWSRDERSVAMRDGLRAGSNAAANGGPA